MPKMEGTDNVYVLGVKEGGQFIPPASQEQVDEMLKESLGIQREQINDFLGDLARLGDLPDIQLYGSLMKHLQSECVFHLSAYGAAATLRIAELTEQLESVDQELIRLQEKVQEQESDLNYWANR